ncbi:extracellular solute-binding protein [Bifidobacterium sp. ESL0728]|uniref:extracellular solute-binding protein n=1 Tax=Bifidobacterium sp. ESL0728 TaxID=2983220 RepID=UPI0023FA301B|nr:extracellular solute-binding protein [Bifidobacterium sp. ESL0728]WEV59138.1 extracellular solute-binding protein [Bifidobacterium sp. ESL0728]
MKKSIKRTIAAGLSVLTLLSLSACGRKTDSGSAKDSGSSAAMDNKPATGNLTIWAMGQEGEKLSQYVKGFEKENPDVKVKVTAIPWSSAHEKVQTAIAAGNGPDISQIMGEWMADFSTGLAQVPSNFDNSDFSSAALSTVKVGGKQVAVPWYSDTRVLYYRTDIAKQAGWDHAPQTWAELKKMAADMQKVNGVQYGMFIMPKTDAAFSNVSPIYYSNGARLTDGKKWTIDNKKMKESFEYIKGFFTDKIADPEADTTFGADFANFVSGKTPMEFNVPSGIGQLNELGGPGFSDKFTTAPIPKKDKNSGLSVSSLSGSALATMKSSKNQTAAWKFIKWASKAKNQVKWYELSTDLPSAQSAWKDPKLANDKKLAPFGEQLKTGVPNPTVTEWEQISITGSEDVEKIYKNTMSVDDALKDMQSKADSIGMGK